MPTRISFLVLLLLVLPTVLLAQEVRVLFQEEGTGTVLADVRVTKEGEATPRFWRSDASGELRLPREEGMFLAELQGFMPQSFRLAFTDEPQVIYLRPFSLDLEGLSIRAFARNRPIFEQAAPIQFLTSKDIQRFQESSLVPVLNTLPGVRMEERSPASYRISIRGSSLRAPFGVRNVKVYWQGIPLTEPGGSTPLNLLETDNVNQIEIIKGPAGSMYGAGTGGAILFSALGDKKEGWQADAGTTIGSFGWLKQHVRVSQGTEKAQWEVLATRQKGDGYREHSSFDRKTVQLNGKFEISDRSKLNVFTLLDRKSVV